MKEEVGLGGGEAARRGNEGDEVGEGATIALAEIAAPMREAGDPGTVGEIGRAGRGRQELGE